MKKSLIIWVPSYSSFDTMKFEGVEFVSDYDDHIEFSYDGVSTGERREATFLHDKIMGWSLTADGSHD